MRLFKVEISIQFDTAYIIKADSCVESEKIVKKLFEQKIINKLDIEYSSNDNFNADDVIFCNNRLHPLDEKGNECKDIRILDFLKNKELQRLQKQYQSEHQLSLLNNYTAI